MRWRRVGFGGTVDGDCVAYVCRTGRKRLEFNGAPITYAVHHARYLITITALLGSYPHFYTLENSERLSHMPKVTY